MSITALDRAAAFTSCDILSTVGEYLIGAAVVPLWPAPYRLGALGVGSLSLFAANYACGPIDVGGQDPTNRSGCQYTPEGGFPKKYTSTGEGGAGFSYCEWVEITEIETREVGEADFVEARLRARHVEGYIAGTNPEWQFIERGTTFGMDPCDNECGGDPNGNLPVPPDAYAPREYTDQSTNCTYNVQLLGFVEEFEGGPQGPVYSIESKTPVRADGGRVGGCNFSPTIYYGRPNGPGPGGGGDGGGGGGDGGGDGGGGGEPPIVIPWDGPIPGGDGEDWQDLLKRALAGAAGAAAVAALNELFSKTYPGLTYRAVSVCEKDADGEDISEAVEVPIPALKAPDAQLARLDAMVELLQAHKNFKQPICGDDKKRPAKEGQWVTTRWISDEKMDHSNHRLRKLFRYRTKSARDIGQLSTYWRDFVWQAGDVCVVHQGAWWGNPQVWASTEAEGQRVIRHAAAEAGLDPDQDGEWAFSSSNSPRYGMSGTMKIQMHEGFPWVAKREGASYPNTLALAHDP